MLGVIGVVIGFCWLAAGGLVACGLYNRVRGRAARAARERSQAGVLAAIAVVGSLATIVAGRI